MNEYEDILSREATVVTDPFPQKRGGGFLGKIVALLLGLILGILATLGAIVGVGYVAVNQPVKGTVDTLNGLLGTDFDYTKFLNESYGDKTILELITDVGEAIGGLSSDGATLQQLDNISPLVGDAVKKLTDALADFGFSVDTDELMATPFSGLTDFVKTTLNETPAGDILGSFGMTSPLLMALCYGEEDVDYELDENGEVVMLGDSQKTLIKDLLGDDINKILDKVPVGSLLTDLDPNDEEDDVMFSIAYGTKNVTYYIEQTEGSEEYDVIMKQVFYYKDGVTFQDYEHKAITLVGEPTPIEGKNGFTLVIDTGKTDDNEQPILKTQHVLYDETTETYLAYETLDAETKELSDPIYYEKTKVSHLTSDAMSLINHLYLKDVLKVKYDSNKILINLAYGVENVDYVIDEERQEILMIGESMPHTVGYLQEHKDDLVDSIHLTDVLEPDFNSGIIMYLLYGEEGIHYEIENKGTENAKVKMSHKYIIVKDGIVHDEHGYELEEDYVLDLPNLKYTYNEHEYTLVQSTQQDETDRYYLWINDEAVPFESTSLGMLKTEHNPINDLTERLTLVDVLGEEALTGNRIFNNLKDTKIQDIPSAVEDLTVKQIFEQDMYKKDKDGNYLDKDGNTTTDPSKYVLTGTWKYLLRKTTKDENGNVTIDKDENGNVIYQDDLPVLTSMTKLMNNMQNNIHTATLQELSDDGIISGLEENLGKDIKVKIVIATGEGFPPIEKSIDVPQSIKDKIYAKNGTTDNIIEEGSEKQPLTLGELTVDEMLSYLNSIFTLFDRLASGNIN